jgi:hypothetical protein
MPDGGVPDLEIISDLPQELKKKIFEHCFLNCCNKSKRRD